MDPQAADDPAATHRWPPRVQVVAAIAWSSFLAASIGTMLVFAVLDPQVIISGFDRGEPGTEPWWLNRTGIYTLGFFFLWLVAAIAGVLIGVLTQIPVATKIDRP